MEELTNYLMYATTALAAAKIAGACYLVYRDYRKQKKPNEPEPGEYDLKKYEMD